MTTQPLDDRDTTPWDEADGETITENEDQEAYKQEREDARMEEHLHGSEGNVY